jgi:hypothetical protein
MSPRRTPPDPWPWPADTPLDRARRVARTYRDTLAAHQPEVCRRLDGTATTLGQGWIVPRPLTWNTDDLLDAAAVADMCDIRPSTVDQWRRRGLHVTGTPDGPRYRVADVLRYQADRRRKRSHPVQPE